MEESSTHDAVFWGKWELNCYNRDSRLKCSSAQLAIELEQSKRYGATFILPANNVKGYELAHQEKKIILPEKDGVTVSDLWDCTKEHYALTAATAFAIGVQIPIKKTTLGHWVAPKSSKYTNIVSHVGLKFFPRKYLRYASLEARIAYKVFGTARVFGVVGRALPFAAVGLAVFDVISIGQCIYNKHK